MSCSEDVASLCYTSPVIDDRDAYEPTAALAAATVLAQFLEARPTSASRVIAIDGPGASGKSTIAAELARLMSIALVHTDDFFISSARDATALTSIEERYDWPRLRNEALVPLRQGRAATFAATRWNWSDAELVTVAPHSVVVLEGVYAAGHRLDDLIDIRVLVATPEDERLARLHARVSDSEWDHGWLVAEHEYFAELAPPGGFDLVLSGSDRVLS